MHILSIGNATEVPVVCDARLQYHPTSHITGCTACAAQCLNPHQTSDLRIVEHHLPSASPLDFMPSSLRSAPSPRSTQGPPRASHSGEEEKQEAESPGPGSESRIP